MNCEETREHLESCEDCRLHVVVEARLRTLPVHAPPKGLADRILRALPRTGPLRREVWRLTAAAAALLILVGGAFAAGLDQHAAVLSAKEQAAGSIKAAMGTLNAWRTGQ